MGANRSGRQTVEFKTDTAMRLSEGRTHWHGKLMTNGQWTDHSTATNGPDGEWGVRSIALGKDGSLKIVDDTLGVDRIFRQGKPYESGYTRQAQAEAQAKFLAENPPDMDKDPRGFRRFDDQGRLTTVQQKVGPGQYERPTSASIKYGESGPVEFRLESPNNPRTFMRQTTPGEYRVEIGESSYPWKGEVRVTAARGQGQPAHVEFVPKAGQPLRYSISDTGSPVQDLVKTAGALIPGGSQGNGYITVGADGNMTVTSPAEGRPKGFKINGNNMQPGETTKIQRGDTLALTEDVGDNHAVWKTTIFPWKNKGNGWTLDGNPVKPGSAFDLILHYRD